MHYLVIPYFIIFIFYIIFSLHEDSEIKYVGIVYFAIISIIIFYISLILQPVVGDSYRYSKGFEYLGSMSLSQLFSIPPTKPYGTSEYGFRLLNWIFWHIYDNYKFFMTGLFIIFLSIFYRAIKLLYKGYEKYYILFSFILYPYFIAFLTSGKRQGLALALMLLAISYFMNEKNRSGYLALLSIPLIHYGSTVVIPFLLLFIYLKRVAKDKILIVASLIYSISLIMSITELNNTFLDFSSYLNSDGGSYNIYFNKEFASKIHYKTGFRIDFTLFSFLPIILFIFFKNYIDKEKLIKVKILLALYLLLNSIYQFMSMVAFSDRFAAFSWFILPIVCYEILRAVHKQYAVLLTVVFLFFGVVLLQIYTGRYFLALEFV